MLSLGFSDLSVNLTFVWRGLAEWIDFRFPLCHEDASTRIWDSYIRGLYSPTVIGVNRAMTIYVTAIRALAISNTNNAINMGKRTERRTALELVFCTSLMGILGTVGRV